jgi:hypothetical protein
VIREASKKLLFVDVWPESEFAAASTEEIEIKAGYEHDFIVDAAQGITDFPWLRPVFEIFIGNRERQLALAKTYLVARGCVL